MSLGFDNRDRCREALAQLPSGSQSSAQDQPKIIVQAFLMGDLIVFSQARCVVTVVYRRVERLDPEAKLCLPRLNEALAVTAFAKVQDDDIAFDKSNS
jgi:hypothetical protein